MKASASAGRVGGVAYLIIMAATSAPRLCCSRPPIHAGQAEYLVGTATRVPSVRNSQPLAVAVPRPVSA